VCEEVVTNQCLVESAALTRFDHAQGLLVVLAWLFKLLPPAAGLVSW
jgi:hypothetical protein